MGRPSTSGTACSLARRLNALSSFTLYESVCRIWTSEPVGFILNPTHQMPGRAASGVQVEALTETAANQLIMRWNSRSIVFLSALAGLSHEVGGAAAIADHAGWVR